jgi:capsular exopolysaccharide synthesis family protein
MSGAMHELPMESDPATRPATHRATETWGQPDEHLVSVLCPDSFESAQYRALGHRLEREAAGRERRVLAVGSPVSGDGKTMTAINLAATLAQPRTSRVLLIDADLRHPSVLARLGIERPTEGLGELIWDPDSRLEDAVRRYRDTRLDVLGAGTCRSDPYGLLRSPRLARIFEQARQSYDRVVVDTPPMLPVPDWRLIEELVDGFLLVVTARRTERRMLAEALDALRPEKVVGLVFNRDDGPLNRYYRQYGDYYRSATP